MKCPKQIVILLEDKNVVLTNKNNEINNEYLHNNKSENHILKKVKGFFGRIFKGRNCFVRF